MSLVVEGRTLIATDSVGHSHRFTLGNQAGQVLEFELSDTILAPGTPNQRMVRCWVALDLDQTPLIVLVPADGWPAVGPWCRFHRIPRTDPVQDDLVSEEPGETRTLSYGLVDPERIRAPRRTVDRTLVLGKPGGGCTTGDRTTLMGFVSSLAVLAVMLLPLWTGLSLWATWVPAFAFYALMIAASTKLMDREARLASQQAAELEELATDEPPPPWLTRPQEPRPELPGPAEALRHAAALAEANMRPKGAEPSSSDPYRSNVALTLADRTLTVTDETGQPHRFAVGHRPGELHALDLCRWTKPRAPSGQHPRVADYLAGIDAQGHALFAITPLHRWARTDITTWCQLHRLRLTRSLVLTANPDAPSTVEPYVDDPEAAELYTPKLTPDTVVIGDHRSGARHWKLAASTWMAAIAWIPVALAGLQLAVWTALLPGAAVLAHSALRVRRLVPRCREHPKTSQVDDWQLLLAELREREHL